MLGVIFFSSTSTDRSACRTCKMKGKIRTVNVTCRIINEINRQSVMSNYACENKVNFEIFILAVNNSL